MIKNGYSLISKEYKNVDEPLEFKDSDGCIYNLSFYNLKQSKHPQRYNKLNKNSIYNINLLLKKKI